jgi:hypothetical protein
MNKQTNKQINKWTIGQTNKWTTEQKFFSFKNGTVLCKSEREFER